MTKRPITWSDEELERVVRAGGLVGTMRRFLADLGAVHPAEARERERDIVRHWCQAKTLLHPSEWNNWLDNNYPSLLPKSPPPLVLSTGTWTRKVRPSYCNRPLWDTPNGNLLHTYPTVVTASDARKLADWLAQYGSEEEKK